jgi:hypothetical protein
MVHRSYLTSPCVRVELSQPRISLRYKFNVFAATHCSGLSFGRWAQKQKGGRTEAIWHTEVTDQSQTQLLHVRSAHAILKAPNLPARIVDTNAVTWTSGQVGNGRSQVERTSLTAYDAMRL